MGLFSKFFSKAEKSQTTLNPESEFIVMCDDQSVSLSHPALPTQTLLWCDLERIGIITTDEGPLYCDFYWVLIGSNSAIKIPAGATGELEFIKRIQEFPNFDNEAFYQACSRVDNHAVTCWLREGKNGSN